MNFKTFLLSLKIFTALHGEYSDKVNNLKSEVQSQQLQSVYLDELESQYISNQLKVSSIFWLRLLLLVEKYPQSKFINIVPFSKQKT